MKFVGKVLEKIFIVAIVFVGILFLGDALLYSSFHEDVLYRISNIWTIIWSKGPLIGVLVCAILGLLLMVFLAPGETKSDNKVTKPDKNTNDWSEQEEFDFTYWRKYRYGVSDPEYYAMTPYQKDQLKTIYRNLK